MSKKVVDLHPPKEHDGMQLDEILTGISPILVIIMILILVILASMKFGFAFSTEANHYEHLEKIVLNCIGVVANA